MFYFKISFGKIEAVVGCTCEVSDTWFRPRNFALGHI